MISALDKELQLHIQLLNAQQKKSRLGVIKSYLQRTGNQAISIEEYNKELEDSEAEIVRGEFFSHEEVVRKSKNWTSSK